MEGSNDNADSGAGLPESVIRLRLAAADARYAGGLVDGARILQLFGDAATELLILHDGDEGLFLAYDEVTFERPVHAGDYIEVRGRIAKVGRTSRKMEFSAYCVARGGIDPQVPSAAESVRPPERVARASGTCVVPKERQRATLWNSRQER